MLNLYYDQKAMGDTLDRGEHREAIGGMWDEIGQLQFDFLVGRGLKPNHLMVDIGCGSLRAGVKLVRYLEPGHYFGTDLVERLLQAGYEIEIAKEGLGEKLPRSNLVVDGEFDFSWCGEPFDFALAQSVFTHLPLNYVRVCLERLYPAMKPSARLFVTFFEIDEARLTHSPFAQPRGEVTTFGYKDPYHYRRSDLEYAAKGLPWRLNYIGEWDHPRNQRMIEFIKSD